MRRTHTLLFRNGRKLRVKAYYVVLTDLPGGGRRLAWKGCDLWGVEVAQLVAVVKGRA